MTLVVRDDLSHRTELSKSQLTTADFCQTAAWFGIHDRRPMLPSERLTFGSAIDAACEQMVYAAARGNRGDGKPMQAALEVSARDGVDINLDEVTAAIHGFRDNIMPVFDWTDAVVQPTVRAEIEGLGPCSGHPDIILADGTILDVKTGKQHKTPFGTELGFYGGALPDPSTLAPSFQRGTAGAFWVVHHRGGNDDLIGALLHQGRVSLAATPEGGRIRMS